MEFEKFKIVPIDGSKFREVWTHWYTEGTWDESKPQMNLGMITEPLTFDNYQDLFVTSFSDPRVHRISVRNYSGWSKLSKSNVSPESILKLVDKANEVEGCGVRDFRAEINLRSYLGKGVSISFRKVDDRVLSFDIGIMRGRKLAPSIDWRNPQLSTRALADPSYYLK